MNYNRKILTTSIFVILGLLANGIFAQELNSIDTNEASINSEAQTTIYYQSRQNYNIPNNRIIESNENIEEISTTPQHRFESNIEDQPELENRIALLTTSWGTEAMKQAVNYDIWVQNKVWDVSDELHVQMEMARSRGMPYLVWVNVPSYTLRVYNTVSGEMELSSRVIVGARGSQTPIFNTDIINIKFNPDWSPTPSMLRMGKRYTPPGPNNPLGQARFSTNNNKNIYLHDTNNKEAFNKDIRALSFGCIRVERWNELAQILGNLSFEEVEARTDGNKINFYDITDSTVWISYERIDLDETNNLALFPDIYGKQHIPEYVTMPVPQY